MTKINLLTKAVRFGISMGMATAVVTSGAAFAQQGQAKEGADDVEKVQITGSRIKRTDVEGAAPIVSISAIDLTNKGFVSAYDAIQSLSAATGTNQGQAFGGFTQNAETVNFRGLGPNRTLVLLNGKRVANYPRAYNGQNNVFNLASIPLAAIERIDVVTGGQSAIYGSDAIAGVMNIITKRGVDETTVSAAGSVTGYGDAKSRKFSVVTGDESEEFSWTLALEHSSQDMLKGNQRPWLDDRFDNPSDIQDYPEYALVMPRTFMSMQFDGGWKYLDPGKETCDMFDNLQHANRPSRGFYCGRDDSGNSSLINDRKNTSVYFTGTYALNENHQVTADVLYWKSDSASAGSQFWDSRFVKDAILDSDYNYGSGYIYDAGTEKISFLQRTWQEEERFGNGGLEEYDEQMLTATLSLTGIVFEDYDYEFFTSYSLSKDKQSEYRVKTEAASDYFISFSEETGPVFNWDRWNKPLDEAGFNQIFGKNDSKSDASVFTSGVNLTGDLIDMPSGPLAFSVLAEYEKSEYDINVNPRTLGKEGEGWAGLTGTEGSGDRSRTAIALEFAIPVLDNLDINLAARYDRYNDDTDVGGAPTYQIGVQYRPVDELLLRANWGTTFRAPDLHNVFKDPSGSYSSVEDFTLKASCDALAAGNLDGILIPDANLDSLALTCDPELFQASYSSFNVQSGEKRLKEETGESLTVGFVWQPIDDLSLTFDLYKILMEDAVTSYPKDRLMRQERDCLAGDEDPNSALCVSTFARIDRRGDTGLNSSYKVEQVFSSFINAAMREQTGFDFQLQYKYETDKYGTFGIKTEYSHVLKTENQWFIGDEIDEDFRDNYEDNSEFRSKLSTVLSYEYDQWLLTLVQYRYGSIPNDVDVNDWTQVEEKRYKPWFNYNLGVNYSFNDDHLLRLGVNNLFNSRARSDASESSSPYFNIFAYPATTILKGREFTMEYVARF